jgi:hypothetical protein
MIPESRWKRTPLDLGHLLSEGHTSQFVLYALSFSGIVRSSQAIGKFKKLPLFRFLCLKPRFDELNQDTIGAGALTLGQNSDFPGEPVGDGDALANGSFRCSHVNQFTPFSTIVHPPATRG